MLASTAIPPAIAGQVYVDNDGDSTFDTGEQVTGATVRLFVDDGDGVFDAGDTQVGTDQTTDSTGSYFFEQLNADNQYFVRQIAQTVGAVTLPDSVSSILTPSTPGLTIDSFLGAQAAQATNSSPNAASVLDTTEAVGGERDMAVALTAGVAMNLLSDQPGAEDVLSFDATSAAQGTYTLAWDGDDSDGDTLAFGLNNLDLTSGGVNTGLFMRAGVDSNGGTVTLRLYDNDALTVSTATVTLPQTSGALPTGFVFVPFTSFSNAAVSASSVDAIEMVIGGDDPVDGQVSIFGAIGPVTQDFVNAATTDLVIAKFSNQGNRFPGQQITYTINVQNAGGAVTGATIADVMPTELTNVQYTSAAQGGATGNTSSGTGDIGDVVTMPAGSSIVYTVTGTVAAGATGTISNTATVTPPSGLTDATPANNTSTQNNNIIQQIDLDISKTDSLTNVNPGQTIEYVVTVTNNGPSAAVAARVTDTLPASLTNVSYTSEVVSGTISGNTASGTGNLNETVDMSVGAVLRYRISATVDPSATGSITNTALVQAGSGFSESIVDNNSATDVDQIVSTADLFVTKDDGITTAVPGETVTYTIVVGNDGPLAVTGATFSDNFPAILTNVSYTSVVTGGATGNTASGTGNLTETLNLPVGSRVTYTVTGTVAPDAHETTATLVNPATVAVPSGITDTDNTNNTDTDTDTLAAEADLAITKTDGVTNVSAGGNVTYQIVVSNQGPSTAAGATVADLFPAELTNVSYTSSVTGGATGNTASGTGNISDTVTLPPNSTITYTVNATVAGSVTGSVTNTATVTAPNDVQELDPTDNTATDIDTVNTAADLAITKTNNTTTVTQGGAIGYTITVTNAGGSTVTGATVADTFPSSITGASYTSSVTGGATGNTASGTGNISDTVTLPAGATITYSVTGTVAGSATGTITNTATVTAPNGVTESDLTNNSDSESDTVDVPVDLVISKTNNTTTVTQGGAIGYTITVTNAGGSTVTGATVADTFPSSITGASYTSSVTGGATGNTASGTGNISDTVTLPAGATITYSVTGTVAGSATGTITNTATVTAPNGVTEPDVTNNSDSESDTVSVPVDLSITKTNNTSTVTQGGAIGYTITVTNAGGSTVTGATVADSFPSSITGASYTSSVTGGATGNTASGTGNISDTVTLPAGATVTYIVSGTVAGSATGTITNTATVTAPNGVTEPDLTNNSDSESDTVDVPVDLVLTKTNNTTTVTQGGAIGYTVTVTNAGSSTVTGATVVDTFPSSITGASYTSSVTGGATGNTASGTGNISDTVTLPAGATVTYIVSGTVAGSATGTITNTATVTAPNGVTEPDLTNNSDSESDTVSVPVDLSITKTNNTTTVTQGGAIGYTITVTNAGGSTVTGATVADTFPSSITGVTYTSSVTGGATGNTASGTGNISDTVTLPAGATVTYSVTGTVAGSATGTITNTATVTAPNGVTESNVANNTDSESDDVSVPVELVLTKSNTSTQISPGGAIQYTILVTNSGAAVTGATVTDTFPSTLSNVTYTSSVTGGATGNTAAGNGNINDTVNMPAGSTITYQVTGTVSNSATGTITNSATVTAPNGVVEPNIINNTDTESDDIPATVDLSITKSDGVTTATPGQTLTYQIVVSNANSATATATGASVVDTFPSTLTNVSYTTQSSGGATGASLSGTGNINDTVNLPPGSSITYTVTATVAAGANGNLTNTATVTAPSGVQDTNTVNNTASDVDNVLGNVDLAINKTNSTTQVNAGGQVQYTIAVSNPGTNPATGATVVDTFPTSLTNVSYTSSVTGGATGNTASGTGNISDTVSLPVGATITYQVTGTLSANASGTLTNTATVSPASGVTDTNTVNNSSTENDTIVANVDLSVTKTDNLTSVAPGQQITYQIVVANSGPSTATGATVVDTFPSTLTNVSFTSTASGGATGNTASGTGNLNQTLTLPANSSVTYTVTATVSPTINTTSLANTVTVTAPSGVTDTDSSDNSATDTDTVVFTPGSISGLVYHDANGDSVFTSGTDVPLSNVPVRLTGTTLTGAAVDQSATTGADGTYRFTNVLPGSYRVQETQPTFFERGPANAGSGTNANTTVTVDPASNNDAFFITLANADNATALNFGETTLALSKRQFLASTPAS